MLTDAAPLFAIDYDTVNKGDDLVITTGLNDVDYSHKINSPVEIWESQDDSGSSGLGWGAFTGGLIGLLAGPGGALAGAAIGGSLGGVIGLSADVAFDDPKLDEFAAALSKDTSALILVGEEATLFDFATAVEPFGGEVIDTNLDEKDVKALKKAMEK